MSFHAEAVWQQYRPLIIRLYTDERCTMPQVRDALCEIGVHVNTIQVKKHIIKWNLHRNLQYADVRTALHILGPDPSKWPCSNPSFRVREREVDFHDFARYLRRRKIRDPVAWAASTEDPFEMSTEVTLISRSTIPKEKSKCSGDSAARPKSLPSAVENHLVATITGDDEKVALGERHILSTSDYKLHGLCHSHQEFRPPDLFTIADPELYRLATQALGQTRNYCISYLASGHVDCYEEPEYHQFTPCGRFAETMKHGIYFSGLGDYVVAFKGFDKGFALLQEIFTDGGPAALALYLQIVCLLSVNDRADVMLKLLGHTVKLITLLPNIPSSLSLLLSAMLPSEQPLELSLLSLQAAVDILRVERPTYWESFFVEDCYCDGLHYPKRYDQGKMRRYRLLIQQHLARGFNAHDTLWTRTMVADDHLLEDEIEAAEHEYTTALEHSTSLSGIGRAHIDFAAHEGLAKTCYTRALRSWNKATSETITPAESKLTVTQDLERALVHADKAIDVGGSAYIFQEEGLIK